MPNSKKVKFYSGEEVTVYVPPSMKIAELVERRYPDPSPPVVESETVTGETIKMVIEDDPDYLSEKARMETVRADEIDKLSTLYALKDVRAPEGWDAEEELGEWLRFADPEWEPREGAQGRRLDYIEWVFLANSRDNILVQQAVAEMIGIDLEAVDRIEQSFRSYVEGETDTPLAETGEDEGTT